MKDSRRIYIFLPVIFAIVLIVGFAMGYYLFRASSAVNNGGRVMSKNLNSENKLYQLINYIDNNYVDTVDTQQLDEEAIVGMLKSLDPHSVYIPASELNDVNDELAGNFEGIGVQFRIEQDTVMIVNTVSGGPSEKVGVLGGDRIVKVNGKTIAGVKITTDKVMKLLKGKKGTNVVISVYRRGVAKLLDFTITRNVIPTWSIDVAYAPTPQIGYVKIAKFSATTEKELHEALEKFNKDGVKKLILDLRGNSGGYLQEAIAVADEFLPKEKLIVYTKGLHRSKQMAYATDEGLWDDKPLVVLIDEGSASASEIVAGAIQDNDRGTIIGRRSFGKGLVQEQVKLSDGSALRLTVARYYTPTGRSIQKPYTKGAEDYFMDILHRAQDGELESVDSIKKNKSLQYKTPKGKIVYGGGGIIPDVFIPIERMGNNDFYRQSVGKGILYQFIFNYTDKNRAALKKYATAEQFDQYFKIPSYLYNEYVEYAKKHGIKGEEKQVKEAKTEITDLMKSYIARDLYDFKGFYPLYLRTDKTFQKAIQTLNKTK